MSAMSTRGANPNANELARKLADEKARGFKCGADKPIVPASDARLAMPKAIEPADGELLPQQKMPAAKCRTGRIKSRSANSGQPFQAKATLSRLRSPNRSDERATALPPSAR